MVRTISVTVEDLAKRLKEVFSAANKETGKYAEVWLSDVEFNGLYQIYKVAVNVKAAHPLASRNEEIKYIVYNIFTKLSKEEHSWIWNLSVYNSNEDVHCESDELLVYNAVAA